MPIKIRKSKIEGSDEGSRIRKCPKCGKEVKKPIKIWKVAPKGRKPISIPLWKCPGCGRFLGVYGR